MLGLAGGMAVEVSKAGHSPRKRFLYLMLQVHYLYYKMRTKCARPVTHERPVAGDGPFEQIVQGGTAATGEACRYLIPVVAMPLMRNRWPKRKTRKTGSRDTMDMANREPQLVADCESTKARRATGTVNMSGSVR